MSKENESNALQKIITNAIQIPGVKVDRKKFLLATFDDKPSDKLKRILDVGPVEAGCSRKELKKLATALVNNRTLKSTVLSFAAGLPGGIAMAASIPADLLQFYGVALRLAQEISYLYGEPDLWEGGEISEERVSQQLILYCGVMFGVSGASATIRVLSSSLGKQVLKKLPQKALTKTFYYPIVKSICKIFGVKMTKNVFAKGVSKAVPILGGIVSGGLTFASMRPMGTRLVDTFDDSKFDYSRAEFEADWEEIHNYEESEPDIIDVEAEPVPQAKETTQDIAATLREYKSLLDDGIITEEEFTSMKAELLSKK